MINDSLNQLLWKSSIFHIGESSYSGHYINDSARKHLQLYDDLNVTQNSFLQQALMNQNYVNDANIQIGNPVVALYKNETKDEMNRRMKAEKIRLKRNERRKQSIPKSSNNIKRKEALNLKRMHSRMREREDDEYPEKRSVANSERMKKLREDDEYREKERMDNRDYQKKCRENYELSFPHVNKRKLNSLEKRIEEDKTRYDFNRTKTDYEEQLKIGQKKFHFKAFPKSQRLQLCYII